MCIRFYGGPIDGQVECHGPLPAAQKNYPDTDIRWSGDVPYTYRIAWRMDRDIHYLCTHANGEWIPGARPEEYIRGHTIWDGR